MSAAVTPAARHRTARNPALVTAVLALTGTIVSLQQTLIVPILPEAPQLLHTSADNTGWLVTATLLTSAVATPVVSRLADMYGKRRMLLLCLVLQIVGSALGALGDSLAVVVAGRAFQGFAVALIPVGISVMRDELPRERVGGAVALMSASIGIGSAIGLPLAGVIYAHTSWHMLFVVSAVMAVLMLAAILLVVPESSVRTPGRFDALGAVLLSVALVCFLLPVSKGGDWGWTSEPVLLLFLASAIVLAAWTPWQLRTGTPLVDLRTAARRPVLLTNLASVLVGFSMYGNMLSTTQLLQMPAATGYGFGLGVLEAGLCMLPGGLAMVVMSPIAARTTRRYGGRTTLIVGSLILGGAYVMRVFLIGQTWQIILGATLVSCGTGLTYSALPSLIMGSVPITETASANGLNSLLRAVGTSTSSAVVSAILTTTVMRLGGHVLPSVDAFKHIFWVCAIGGLGAALVAVFIPVPQRSVAAPVQRDGAELADVVARGRVTATGLAGVRSAVVTVLDLDGRQVDWARVEPDGSYAIVVPGPGEYLAVTAADGWAPHSSVIRVTGESLHDIDLGDRLELTGRITYGGKPIQALVTLTRLGGEFVASTQAGPDGRYTVPLPSHGRHVIAALDPTTRATAAANLIAVGATREVDLELASSDDTGTDDSGPDGRTPQG